MACGRDGYHDTARQTRYPAAVASVPRGARGWVYAGAMALIEYDASDVSAALTEDKARFIGRANCLIGIQQFTEQMYGERHRDAMAAKAVELIRVKRRRTLSGAAARLLRIAWQTELSANMGSGFDDPALRRVSMHTMPVSAYFALYSLLRVFRLVVEGNGGNKHASMHKYFARHRVRQLPLPWRITLAGDPEDGDGCLLDPPGITEPYGFNPMERGHDPAAYVCMALRMTRRWKVASARLDWLADNRKADGSPRKQLPKGQRATIVADLRPTTLLDLVYELRRRANYESADEYSAEVIDADVSRFHDGLSNLLDSGMLVIEAQLAALIGCSKYEDQAMKWFDGAERVGVWAAQPLARRALAIHSALS
jgi:hypothetical protein